MANLDQPPKKSNIATPSEAGILSFVPQCLPAIHGGSRVVGAHFCGCYLACCVGIKYYLREISRRARFLLKFRPLSPLSFSLLLAASLAVSGTSGLRTQPSVATKSRQNFLSLAPILAATEKEADHAKNKSPETEDRSQCNTNMYDRGDTNRLTQSNTTRVVGDNIDSRDQLHPAQQQQEVDELSQWAARY